MTSYIFGLQLQCERVTIIMFFNKDREG